eukprot:898329-Amorphochlora_amoeboformis.AAC.2
MGDSFVHVRDVTVWTFSNVTDPPCHTLGHPVLPAIHPAEGLLMYIYLTNLYRRLHPPVFVFVYFSPLIFHVPLPPRPNQATSRRKTQMDPSNSCFSLRCKYMAS